MDEPFFPSTNVEIRESVERIVFFSISFTDLLSLSVSFSLRLRGVQPRFYTRLFAVPCSGSKLGSLDAVHGAISLDEWVRFLLSSHIKIHLEWVDRGKEN